MAKFKLSAVARSTDGSGLDGGCEDDVSRLTPGLHPETTFDMNDLPSNAYTLDTRRMQLYSHPHEHPTVSQRLCFRYLHIVDINLSQKDTSSSSLSLEFSRPILYLDEKSSDNLQGVVVYPCTRR